MASRTHILCSHFEYALCMQSSSWLFRLMQKMNDFSVRLLQQCNSYSSCIYSNNGKLSGMWHHHCDSVISSLSRCLLLQAGCTWMWRHVQLLIHAFSGVHVSFENAIYILMKVKHYESKGLNMYRMHDENMYKMHWHVIYRHRSQSSLWRAQHWQTDVSLIPVVSGSKWDTGGIFYFLKICFCWHDIVESSWGLEMTLFFLLYVSSLCSSSLFSLSFPPSVFFHSLSCPLFFSSPLLSSLSIPFSYKSHFHFSVSSFSLLYFLLLCCLFSVSSLPLLSSLSFTSLPFPFLFLLFTPLSFFTFPLLHFLPLSTLVFSLFLLLLFPTLPSCRGRCGSVHCAVLASLTCHRDCTVAQWNTMNCCGSSDAVHSCYIKNISCFRKKKSCDLKKSLSIMKQVFRA